MIGGFVGKMGSGKTLSMVRETLRYYAEGYKIYSNFHINIPYTPIDFNELMAMAESQEDFGNVVFFALSYVLHTITQHDYVCS